MCIDHAVGQEPASIWEEIAEQGRKAAEYYCHFTGEYTSPIGSGALTVREVGRSVRKYLVGDMSYEDLRAWHVPLALDLNAAINTVIDEEEAGYERMRAEAHKLRRGFGDPQAAALPQHLKGKVKVSIVGNDGKLQVIAESDKISFGAFPGKTLGVCRCDMKDLMSGVPHRSDCPEKKR